MKINNKLLTPFFPGIAHSHIIKFNVPSIFFSGRATNPYILFKNHKTIVNFFEFILNI